jgi:threonine dehydrogenase-like Zn-dependent dehydrogenase
MGARVIALDVSAQRLARAREFGADAVIDPSKDDPVKAIRDLTHGAGADRSLDASSSPQARAQAVRCVRTWGIACYVGEGGDVTIEVSPDMLRRQVTIVASWTFSSIGQGECARYVTDRKIDVDHLFTHRWKLEQAAEAYTLFDQQKTGKGVFLM